MLSSASFAFGFAFGFTHHSSLLGKFAMLNPNLKKPNLANPKKLNKVLG